MERDLRILALGMAIRTFGAAIYSPFLALFLYSILHVGYFDIGAILLGVGLFQLPFGLIGGLWSDRGGRRRLIVLSLVAEAVFTAVLAYSFSIESLALAIAAAAVGGAVLSATGAAFSAYIADWSLGSQRTLGFTWYRVSFNAGFAAGVALGGTLVAFVGFAGAVAMAAVIIAGAAGFVAGFLRPSPYDRALRAGTAPVPAGAAPFPPRSLRASLGLLAQDRTALWVAAGFCLVAVTSAQWSVTFSLFVHNKLGVSYAILGIGLALNGLVVVVGQAPTTRGVLGMRHTTIAILGGAFYVAGFLLLGASARWELLPTAAFFVAVVVLTFGENLLSIPTSTLPSNLAPPAEIGAYNGGFSAVQNAASLAAIFLGGVVLSAVADPLYEWLLLVAPAVPGVLLLRWVSRRIPLTVDRA